MNMPYLCPFSSFTSRHSPKLLVHFFHSHKMVFLRYCYCKLVSFYVLIVWKTH
ncbi:hypothetical protein Hanom_Chr09g00804021 [Helianthus anomalus]